MPSPYPPHDEQVRIADTIKRNTCAIDDAIDRCYRQIDLIREYRTRLIADVVTGKLDVREAAGNLPEEAEELEMPDEAEALENEALERDEAELVEEPAGADG
jgi:type I restriction enzyme S subunit